MYIRLLGVLLLIMAAAESQAHSIDTLWTRNYGGTLQDVCSAMLLTPDSGLLLGGTTSSFGVTTSGLYVVRTDANGDTLWTAIYDGPGIDMCYALLQTADNGYLYAGCYNRDAYLVKANTSGDTLWTRTYGGDFVADVQQTADGGYILAGEISSQGYLIKTNANGDSLWSHTISEAGNIMSGFTSVRQTMDGGYILGGSNVTDELAFYPWIVKTDAAGYKLWSYQHACSYTEFNSVLSTGGDEYIFCGPKGIVKINTNGDTLWTREYSVDALYTIRQFDEQEYILLGNASNGDGLLQFTDLNGNIIENRVFGWSNDEEYRSFVKTDNDGYVIAGSSSYFGAGPPNFWVMRFAEGSPRIESINDVGNDQGRRVRLTWTHALNNGAWMGNVITDYAIFRRVEEGYLVDDPRRPLPDNLDWPPGQWDYVKTVPAFGEEEYSTTVETLGDSTSEITHWSTFFIRAMTDYPGTYYDSPVDSGYSFDNISPAATMITSGLSILGNYVIVRWEEISTGLNGQPEQNGIWYRVYGDTDPEFVPESGNLLTTTQALSFSYPITEDQFYFKVLVSDDH